MGTVDFARKIPSLLGSKVDIYIEAGLYKGRYPSRLEGIDGDVWSLAHPFFKGGLLPIYRELTLKLVIGTEGSLYSITVTAIRMVLNDKIPFLLVRADGCVDKIQRRRFVRVPCALKGVMALLGGDQGGAAGEKWFSVFIKDISLGGAGIVVQASQFCLEQKDRIMLSVGLPGSVFFVPCEVAIVRRSECRCEVGLNFEIRSVSTEKVLGKFIRQQELMSRAR